MMLGTSSTTAISKARRARCGQRTGVTAVTVAGLPPRAFAVPGYATAPALAHVSCLMLREMLDPCRGAAPAALAALLMPSPLDRRWPRVRFISYAGLKC